MKKEPDIHDPIEIEPYNPDWSLRAKKEIQQLRALLPPEEIIAIEHVGSTAIPNMSAKPIIDIIIGVEFLNMIKPLAIPIIEKLGYQYWYENPNPDKMFFAKGMPPFGNKRTHHVHILKFNSLHWQEKVVFLNYLLKHPEKAEAYELLKKKLASEYPYDREAYTDEKKAFVHTILRLHSEETALLKLSET